MNNKPLNNTTPTFNNKVVVSGNKVVSKEKIRYKYIAFDKNGKQIKGYFDAFRKSDVESFLTVQGYKIAEKSPDRFHATSPFNIETGELKKEKKADYSKIFGEKLVKLARENEKIVAVTASMKD